ncbi:outer membrane beta-barrel protein [Halanaerobium sp. Z-7514]|uniref:Outer membrane beta-barrel protein n=1 Tax=Halanaerobium polyolivorans TaxID=2886943 RepID=A0AAW4WU96_9FIRM|nr:outer membrane beta-barrel protein [Halanaerobium polyolivorans]MCC3144672.1 outer membrane beta-barrel protein [Halanaerobium polyolivorans]RQD73261.1 MAG: hypothetical protein D5S01_08125 [Halanaerobium sp. MSAO_Bac5]
MKKVVFLLVISLIVFSGVAAAQTGGDFVFRLGYDMSGEMDIDGEDYDVESGYSLTAEYRLSAADNFSYGAGITYQLERDVDITDGPGDVGFNYTPIYLLGEYRMAEQPLYFVGHLGYNLFSIDEDVESESGGLYYALGGGIEFEDRYLLELLYTVNNSSIEVESGNGNNEITPAQNENEFEDIDLKYTKFTISLGIKF